MSKKPITKTAKPETEDDPEVVTTDAEAKEVAVDKMSSDKVSKAREIVKAKEDADPTLNEPSTYNGIVLTDEEAAATDPAKFILAKQLSKEETEDEAEDEPEVVKGHIDTPEEHLQRTLKRPDTAKGKVRKGHQAPLQFANSKIDEYDDYNQRVQRRVASAAAEAVRGKV